jgi:hypothetical protein
MSLPLSGQVCGKKLFLYTTARQAGSLKLSGTVKLLAGVFCIFLIACFAPFINIILHIIG